MSEPVPLLRCSPDPVASHAQRWKERKMGCPCDATMSDFKQNRHRGDGQNSDVAPGAGRDMEVSDLGSRAAEHLKHRGARSPEQDKEGTTELFSVLDRSSCNHLPASANASEDCSLDLLRIVKHKPSAIAFCDHDCNSDNQAIFANESSDTGESSSSTTEDGERQDDNDEDDFPEMLKCKEFPISCHRRNLSRNRKVLRKRPDAHPKSTASGWRKPTSEGQPEFAGSEEEQDTLLNNGRQVRRTRQEESDNKHKEVLLTA